MDVAPNAVGFAAHHERGLRVRLEHGRAEGDVHSRVFQLARPRDVVGFVEACLELHDDGDGFRLKDRHDGMGLAGMRERVEQMGGELEITSSRGKGTKITVLLPCNGESTL